MNYIISENQLRSLLTEAKDSKLTDYMKTLSSFAKSAIIKTQKIYGINLKFLSKWGSAIGGIVMPLDNWIRTKNFKLNDDQIALLLIGVVCTFYFENKSATKQIYEKINEEGLEDEFYEILSKGDQLRNAFFKFLNSLNLTFSQMVEMVSYSFLIPIVTDLVEFSHGGDLYQTSEVVAERLLASGTIALTGTILVDVIGKILKRFSK